MRKYGTFARRSVNRQVVFDNLRDVEHGNSLVGTSREITQRTSETSTVLGSDVCFFPIDGRGDFSDARTGLSVAQSIPLIMAALQRLTLSVVEQLRRLHLAV